MPEELTQEQYLLIMGKITGEMYRDIQVAQQFAARVFGPGVTPETVLAVYDRILDRIPEFDGDREQADGGQEQAEET